MAFSLIKFFQNFGGITYRTPELLKDSTYATDMLNVRLSENFSLSKRRGFQTLSKAAGTGGIITYNNVDLGTGTATEERLVISDVLSRIITQPLYVYKLSGPDTTIDVAVQLDPSTSTFKFVLRVDGNNTVVVDLGTGLEGSPVTIADLISAVALSTNYRIYYTGTTTIPAAFIKTTEPIAFLSSSVPTIGTVLNSIINVEYFQTVTAPGSFVPFDLHEAKKANADWQICSSTQLNDVLYITNEDDGLIKYDGNLVYKAGLPNAPIPTVNTVSGVTVRNWQYRVLYTHTDAKDNIINSRISEPLTVAIGATFNIAVNISNIESQGYDTNSARFKVELYRTVSGGTVFYKVNTKVPSDAASSIITFDSVSHSTTDANLILLPEFVFPQIPITPPPKCRYIDVWRNQLAMTGDPTAVNTAYVSDLLTGIESFPQALSVITGSRFGGANSGIRSLDNHLYVFKANAINMVSGDINAGATNIQVDTIADDGIGALSHSSIIEASGSLYFVSRNGVYSINSEGLKPQSDALIPLFTRYTFKENRVIAFNWVVENKLLFLLPEFTGLIVAPTSRVLVYDMIVQAWTIWNNLDFSSGISLDQQDVWFCGSEKYSQILDLKSVLDYADHEKPVSFVYKTHWETVGEPSIPKKFNRIKVYTLDTELQTFDSSIFTLDVTTQHNYQDLDISSVSMDFGSVNNTGYGDSPYGEFQYGNVKTLTDTKRLAAQKAQSLRTIFNNNVIHENVLISGFELEISAPYSVSIKDGR